MSDDVERLVRGLGLRLDYHEIRARERARRAAGGAPIPLVARVPRRAARLGRPWRVAVTSPQPGCGCTTIAANLAMALAQRALRVAAVDLDPAGALAVHLRGDGSCEEARSLDGLSRGLDAAVADVPASLVAALPPFDDLLLVVAAGRAWSDPLRAGERLAARARAPARWILNGYDERRAAHRQAWAALRGLLGDRLFPTPLHWDPVAVDARAAGVAIAAAAPWSQLAADLDGLAGHIADAATPPPLSAEVRAPRAEGRR